MHGSVSDQELIAGCVEGQKESWDLFVDRFSKLIYWSIWRVLDGSSFAGRADLAHEVFQDIFEKLLERNELKKLRQAQGIRKYLTVTACRATIDKVEALGRQERRFDDLNGLNGSGPGLQVISRERDRLIAQTIEGLSPKDRLCVEWHYVDGKTHREISELLGLPQDTVSSIIRRAKEKLRKIFLEKGILE